MKANSVIFPLTNPSQPPDKGRRLATSARPCQKSQIRAEFALRQRSSGECRITGLPKRLSTNSFEQRPLNWPEDLPMLFAWPCIPAQWPRLYPLHLRRLGWMSFLPLRRLAISWLSSINYRWTETVDSSTGAVSACLGDRMARIHCTVAFSARANFICGRPFVRSRTRNRDLATESFVIG